MKATEQEIDSAWALLFACWLVAGASTLGALFLSEVMAVTPCVLCWYQRIFMFPLVLVLPAGLIPFDRKVVRYALPLALVGWFIAVFHVLLVAGYIPEGIKPCTQGVSCTEDQIVWFGFLKIPHLSLLAFSVVVALLVFSSVKYSRRKDSR
ncbi:MAG: 2-oxoglutarate dehydrogenase [Betaproteobacteria bacterium RIFCSPLOWO2_12_FULL_63_13]|nr:MAG: 2-oxoglutarate dehydrogenase [Betaproteobacteria bacterium RIFCSPLOWO2_02_FULL_63_19]OGA47570.1 MAG: 2-oxoglutarate dehydrogenase [Betaproteobacteria bacterium RIFCSPLOWO2_12_FULL_63_13]